MAAEVAVARAAGAGRRWVVRPLGGGAEEVTDTPGLADVVRNLERESSPRWVWGSTASVHPLLLAHGVRVARCHDVAMTEALLVGHDGRYGAPASLAAAWERLLGREPVAPPPAAVPEGADEPETLFAPEDEVPLLAEGTAEIDALVRVHAAQQDRIAAVRQESPGFGLLVAADSAAALVAAEMGATGLPWRADVHDRILEAALGPRPPRGQRPPVLQALAERIAADLHTPGLNPDSPVTVVKAFQREGVALRSTRRHELRQVDHPAVEPLLAYKELARLHVAHGWAWRDAWVRQGRLRPAYIASGVVSGRWATRGGSALQIPKTVRSAVVADEGWTLVMADAGQLEPRLLAALSQDPGMVEATARGDLYAALAEQALGKADARAEAKIALLSAMYGGGSGAGSAGLKALQRRFPRALELLEDAARTGEGGGLVRSVLGRTCPLPGDDFRAGPAEVVEARARARGRFTRNFVIQASAADWANVLLAELRRRLELLHAGHDGPRCEIVFFQHDEVIVHAPEPLAEAVVAALAEAGAAATRLVIGERGVQVPLEAQVGPSYGAKK